MVTYNPNFDFVIHEIQRISSLDFVSTFIIVDNNSRNFDSRIYDCEKVTVIKNSKNVGLASALNQMFEKGESLNEEWLTFLDQDTVIPLRCLETYEQNCNKACSPEVGIFCCSSVAVCGKDFANKEKPISQRMLGDKPISVVPRCVTSGACFSIKCWKAIGKFMEDLFIDDTDYEFCFRLTKNNFQIIRFDDISFYHELFDSETKSIRLFNMSIQYNDVSVFRLDYKVRNYLFLRKLYRDFPRRSFFILKFFIKSIFLEKQKMRRLHTLIQAIFDSKKMYIQFIQK